MPDLNKNVSCLEKRKRNNFQERLDKLKYFLLKGFHYDCKDVIKLTDGTIAANVIKSAIFNGKVALTPVGT